MAIYRVEYASMTARYGPSYIEADDEWTAKRRFAGTAFGAGEMGCISAREVSSEEVRRALASREADNG
jgi:hypothetical protein